MKPERTCELLVCIFALIETIQIRVESRLLEGLREEADQVWLGKFSLETKVKQIITREPVRERFGH